MANPKQGKEWVELRQTDSLASPLWWHPHVTQSSSTVQKRQESRESKISCSDHIQLRYRTTFIPEFRILYPFWSSFRGSQPLPSWQWLLLTHPKKAKKAGPLMFGEYQLHHTWAISWNSWAIVSLDSWGFCAVCECKLGISTGKRTRWAMLFTFTFILL